MPQLFTCPEATDCTFMFPHDTVYWARQFDLARVEHEAMRRLLAETYRPFFIDELESLSSSWCQVPPVEPPPLPKTNHKIGVPKGRLP